MTRDDINWPPLLVLTALVIITLTVVFTYRTVLDFDLQAEACAKRGGALVKGYDHWECAALR